MSHVLHVPDDLYATLAHYAAERGQTVDELLLTYMREVVNRTQSQESGASTSGEAAEDPLAPFIGAFVFGVGDLAENHDRYLAQSYAGTHDPDE